jgi:hypothetical protein
VNRIFSARKNAEVKPRHSMTQEPFYFRNLKFDVARRPIPIIPIIALVDDGRIPKNSKVAEVNAIISPAINKMILIVLPLSILLNYF